MFFPSLQHVSKASFPLCSFLRIVPRFAAVQHHTYVFRRFFLVCKLIFVEIKSPLFWLNAILAGHNHSIISLLLWPSSLIMLPKYYANTSTCSLFLGYLIDLFLSYYYCSCYTQGFLSFFYIYVFKFNLSSSVSFKLLIVHCNNSFVILALLLFYLVSNTTTTINNLNKQIPQKKKIDTINSCTVSKYHTGRKNRKLKPWIYIITYRDEHIMKLI